MAPQNWSRQHNNQHVSNDKSVGDFEVRQVNDGSVLRAIKAIAPFQARNIIVMEIKGNLMKDERKALIEKFPSTMFKKIAQIQMGEPSLEYRKVVQDALLTEKQRKSDEEFRKRKVEEKRQREAEKRQKALVKEQERQKKEVEKQQRRKERFLAKKAAAEKKATEEAAKKALEIAKKQAEEAAKKAEEAAKLREAEAAGQPVPEAAKEAEADEAKP